MLYIIKLVCNILFPPGIFILLLILFSVWLYRRDRVAARIVALITIVMFLCSTPWSGILLLRPLENKYRPPAIIEGDVLVMLTGGATLDTPDINGLGHLSGASSSRLLTTARLQKKTNLPIILSGGQFNQYSGNESQIAKRCLIDLGVPSEKIIIEDAGLNTSQSAVNTKMILEKKGFKKPILITSAYHMYRSVLNFKKNDIEVIPYPCDYQYNSKTQLSIGSFFPVSFDSVWITLHEYIGILALSVLSK